MALAQSQRALAALLTDGDARARLRDDAAAFAREFSLTLTELEQARAIGGRGLDAYAGSLERKRASEAAHLLPLGARALGTAFYRAFAAYARRVPLAPAPGRDLRDALGFAREAAGLGECPAPLRELLDYEATWLRARASRVRLSLRRFDYPVSALAREVAAGGSADAVAPRRTRVLWLACAGRVRTLVW